MSEQRPDESSSESDADDEPQGSQPPVEAMTVHDRVTATGIAAPKVPRTERKPSDPPRITKAPSSRPPRPSAPRISNPPPLDGLGANAVARPLHELPAIGQFGRFALLGRIAFGGMAEIFLAREENPTTGSLRHIVVKRVLPHVADDQSFVQMFLDEARLAIRLQHPNICHIYEFGETDGSYFIAMEWVNGVPLGRLLRRAREKGGMNLQVAVRIIAQIAEALHYAHRARDEHGNPIGIVHRDVSLQNIMVSYEGAVKLLDFGVAKAITHSTKTSAGVVKGKLSYMAPEQARGEEVDARADVFALGICLYEALTCRALYHRTTEYETLRAIIDGPVPSARAVDPNVPAVLDAIVQRALQKSAADRFADAGELQNALEQYLAEERAVVNSGHVGEFVRMLYAEEITRGPLVDSSPFVLPMGTPSDRPQARPSMIPTQAAPISSRPAASGAPVIAPATRPSNKKGLVALLLGGAAALVLLVVVSGVFMSEPRDAATSERNGALQTPPSKALGGSRDPAVVPTTVVPDSAVAASDEPIPEAELAIGDWATPPPAPPRRPAKTPRPQRPLEPSAPQVFGKLSINTRPWSRVYLGARLLGTTPLGNIDVPAGDLSLRFVDRDGAEHRRRVTVREGQRESAFFDLTSAAQ